MASARGMLGGGILGGLIFGGGIFGGGAGPPIKGGGCINLCGGGGKGPSVR